MSQDELNKTDIPDPEVVPQAAATLIRRSI
jgi:hypothetical protein